jgi:hypothetical protein
MTPKRLEQESVYNYLDEDGDGVISDEELMKAEKIAELEAIRAREKDRDAKEDQLRQMAWVAMISMVLFTVVLFLPIIDNDRIGVLDNLLQMFYIAQAGVVATFFGSSAYMNRNM